VLSLISQNVVHDAPFSFYYRPSRPFSYSLSNGSIYEPFSNLITTFPCHPSDLSISIDVFSLAFEGKLLSCDLFETNSENERGKQCSVVNNL
jgi:hypothetical protein